MFSWCLAGPQKTEKTEPFIYEFVQQKHISLFFTFFRQPQKLVNSIIELPHCFRLLL